MSKQIYTFNNDRLTKFKAWLEKGSKTAYWKMFLIWEEVLQQAMLKEKNTGIKKILESLFQDHFLPQIITELPNLVNITPPESSNGKSSSSVSILSSDVQPKKQCTLLFIVQNANVYVAKILWTILTVSTQLIVFL